MRLIRSLQSLRIIRSEEELCRSGRFENTVVTIGNFDGVHLGHQALFKRLGEIVAGFGERPATRVLMTFHPHPKVFFHRQRGGEFHQLSSMRERMEVAADFGFDYFFVVPFTKSFSSLSPEDFVRAFLADGLGAKSAVVGHDWAFGRGRSGNAEVFKTIGEKYRFGVEVVPTVLVDGVRVSSRTVKDALSRGDLVQVERFLGRRYSLTGRVQRGEARGRTLGFPTANLELADRVLPADGVYATWLTVDGKRHRAATNIGTRPTFGEGRRVVEAYIFDEGRFELYGKRIHLDFVYRLRDERRFGNVQDLIRAMRDDVDRAGGILK